MKLLRSKDCARLFGVHHTTWEKWVTSNPDAPKPVIKTRGYVVWTETQVLEFQGLLIREGKSGYVKKSV